MQAVARAFRQPFRLSILAPAMALVLSSCAPAPTADRSGEPGEPDELPSIEVVRAGAFPLDAHLEATTLAEMTVTEVFGAGGDLFHTEFESADGVGIGRLPDGTMAARFSGVPPGGGAQAGTNSQACGSCHVNSASGPATMNVTADPDGDGAPPFAVRNTTSLFGNGLLQILAWEMTEELQAVRDDAIAAAESSPGEVVERPLTAKGIDFGVVRATATADGTVSVDTSGVEGVDPDLVVRPLGAKGNNANLRTVVVGAAAGLMGMFAEEFVRAREAPADLDGDGVEREFAVGDITAITVYNAGQEVPQELADLVMAGEVAAPNSEAAGMVERGRSRFDALGCTSCHVPELRISSTVFEEPTRRGNDNYYDAGLAAADLGYDPDAPIRLDLATGGDEPRVETDGQGGATLRLYADLRRHSMGRQLADPGPVPASVAGGAPLLHDGEMVLIGPDVFLTPELWGVGNTGPWLHDGRAASLTEAILLHGEDAPAAAAGEPGRSEAQESRDGFAALSEAEQREVVAFLRSLRTVPGPR